jgi:hypothetical protein
MHLIYYTNTTTVANHAARRAVQRLQRSTASIKHCLREKFKSE